eukprot:450200_1
MYSQSIISVLLAYWYHLFHSYCHLFLLFDLIHLICFILIKAILYVLFMLQLIAINHYTFISDRENRSYSFDVVQTNSFAFNAEHIDHRGDCIVIVDLVPSLALEVRTNSTVSDDYY